MLDIVQHNIPFTRLDYEDFDSFVYRMERELNYIIKDLDSVREKNSVRIKYVDESHAVIMYTKDLFNRKPTHRKVIKNDV